MRSRACRAAAVPVSGFVASGGHGPKHGWARLKVAVPGIVLPLAILYPLPNLSLVVAVLLDRAIALLVNRPARKAAR